jgi:hypothetical protein
MNSKIQDNPTYSKFKKNIEGIDALKGLVNIAGLLGYKNTELDEVFSNTSNLKAQFELLSTTPDKFNQHFADKGWIAYESMNFEIMKKAVELADNNKIEEAEKCLIEYYGEKDMQWKISSLNHTKPFSLRRKSIAIALEDYKCERYHSCILTLLVIIDGCVNDVDKGKGFFSDAIDLVAWDSVAAHSSGLAELKNLFFKTRKKTNTEPIYIPYRNGILHGRDLNFDNVYVASKLWGALFAIADWVKAVNEGKKNKPVEEPKLSITESLQQLQRSIQDYEVSKVKNELLERKIEEWKPRLDLNFEESGNINNYEINSPERELVVFFNFWKLKKYGNIANQIHPISKKPLSTLAGKVRKNLEYYDLVEFKIKKITDKAPAISEIEALITIEFNGKAFSDTLEFRWVYGNENGRVLVRGEDSGRWQFIDILQNVEFIQFKHIYNHNSEETDKILS